MDEAPAAPIETPAPVETPVVETPTYAGGKYTNIADLEKGYLELQAKLGSGTPSEPEAPPPAADPNAPLQIPSPEAASPPELTTLDPQTLGAEWAENDGALTEATLERLTKAGIAPSLVDAFVAGQEALAAKANAKIHEVSGSEAATDVLFGWAASNLDEGSLNALNTQLASPDINTRVLAMHSLVALQAKAGGSVPLAGGTPNSGTTAFRSDAEMTAAMRDPRYASDPAYRADFQTRVAAMVARGA